MKQKPVKYVKVRRSSRLNKNVKNQTLTQKLDIQFSSIFKPDTNKRKTENNIVSPLLFHSQYTKLLPKKKDVIN